MNFLRFLIIFLIALLPSALLFSIEWFTWQAWIFVAFVLALNYYLFLKKKENAEIILRAIITELREGRR